MLLTGNNQSLGKALSGTMFGGSFTVNTSDLLPSLADNVLVCLLFFFPFVEKKLSLFLLEGLQKRSMRF
ncbi:unnamed protein product [Brassica rapa subsp. trilocularis]